MPTASALQPIHRPSLREQVYDVLREALDRAEMKPGDVIDLNAVAARLGVSRTPLREAILRLETEGFLTIKPRSGVVVRTLTETDIRNLFQMIGALESSILLTESARVTAERVAAMRRLTDVMDEAIKAGDFERFHGAKVALRDAYLDLTGNAELRHLLTVMKQRLYDFPKKKDLLLEWEAASVKEHQDIIARLEQGDAVGAAEVLRDVHWNFEAQERFVRIYYREELTAARD